MDLRRQLAVVALVYVIEGFPMGVYQHVLSVYFRRHGVSLTEIGLLSALGFAWTAEAALVAARGALSARARTGFGGSLLAMAAWARGESRALPGETRSALPSCIALAIYCIASATQDIAIDGYTIELVDRGSAKVPRMRCAPPPIASDSALSASGLLLLPAWIGWRRGVSGGGGWLSALFAGLARARRRRSRCRRPPSVDRCTRWFAWLRATGRAPP